MPRKRDPDLFTAFTTRLPCHQGWTKSPCSLGTTVERAWKGNRGLNGSTHPQAFGNFTKTPTGPLKNCSSSFPKDGHVSEWTHLWRGLALHCEAGHISKITTSAKVNTRSLLRVMSPDMWIHGHAGQAGSWDHFCNFP